LVTDRAFYPQGSAFQLIGVLGLTEQPGRHAQAPQRL
jgi:hypothetical protein